MLFLFSICFQVGGAMEKTRVIHTHRYRDADAFTACLIRTHVVVATREEVVSDRALGTEGHRKRKPARLEVVQTRGGLERRRLEQQ
ncbi:hypothetical protein NQZ68_014379 [Dissostichus eleginoides]|nr:hypothetical protein NQZ68_014379 [Dissostichus eleginoides]